MEHLAETLARGAESIDVALDSDKIARLEDHLRLLAKWNAKLNLVGPGSLESWAVRHTLDSLAVSEWVENGTSVADVGSGAGFPGLPCAIARPGAAVTLLEPRANRAAFLQNAIALTRISNAVVRVAKAEAESLRFQLVLGRAVAPLLPGLKLPLGCARRAVDSYCLPWMSRPSASVVQNALLSRRMSCRERSAAHSASMFHVEHEPWVFLTRAAECVISGPRAADPRHRQSEGRRRKDDDRR